uniref:Uncharacterized protein n=1 Tax=uncultured marine thaumarchaeote KM3_06_C02 TaxID=1455976 RepID=A0A075GAF6_9ARCH|nr:hypothetical protein [uncultured marine thaumarchaeote KM3_06_C02]
MIDRIDDNLVEDKDSIPIEHKKQPQIELKADGYYFRLNGTVKGPYKTTVDTNDPMSYKRDKKIAEDLGLSAQDIFRVKECFAKKEISLEWLGEILSTTIKSDDFIKEATFLIGINTFSDNDHSNIAFCGESSSGKTYITKEILKYFPKDYIIRIDTASPTALHNIENPDLVSYDEETFTKTIDYENKILYIGDMDTFKLAEKIRPFLSFDNKYTKLQITNKSKGGRNRTDNIVLKGFATTIYCTARSTMNEQEQSRMFTFTPQTSQDKLHASVDEASKRLSDIESYNNEFETNEIVLYLMSRVIRVIGNDIRQVIIPNANIITGRFFKNHKILLPRHNRDLQRLFSLIKAIARLNYCGREKAKGETTILANDYDIKEGFKLYGHVSEASEMGLTEDQYQLFKDIFVEFGEDKYSVKDTSTKYYEFYGKTIQPRKLIEVVIPHLMSAGLVEEDRYHEDKRITVYGLTKKGQEYRNRIKGRMEPKMEEFVEVEEDPPIEFSDDTTKNSEAYRNRQNSWSLMYY